MYMYEKKRIFSPVILTAVFFMGILLTFSSGRVLAAGLKGPGVDSIENTSEGIMLEWYKESGATGYYIYRRCLEEVEDSGRIYTVAKSPATRYATVEYPAATGWEDRIASWTDKDVAVGKFYVYYLRAFNEKTGATSKKGDSAGIERFLTRAEGKPGLFEKPEVTAENKQKKISVRWTKVAGATGYYIYRYENGKGGLYAVAGNSATGFMDKSVTSGKVYSYYVSAYSKRSGATSHDGSGTVLRLPAPQTVKVSRSRGSFILRWKGCRGAKYYYVEVSGNRKFSKSQSYWATGTDKKLTGLVPGKFYYARLRAYDKVKQDCSCWSKTVRFKISKKTMSKKGRVLKYSGRKTSLQKMWTVGPSSACIEFLNLIKENKNGASMSFMNQKSYSEAVRYYFMLTGDGKVISRNDASASMHTLTFTVKKNSDNRAYATGAKGYFRYYKKAYKMLSKAGVKSGMSAYEAAMKIETYIRGTVKYGGSWPNNHNFYSLIDSQKGVCQAYAQLFQVMCVQAGIDCRYCAGSYKGKEGHAWNRFKADGTWHYIDVTFRDSSGVKAWPVSERGLKNHKAEETLKFIDASAHYNCGISPRPRL